MWYFQCGKCGTQCGKCGTRCGKCGTHNKISIKKISIKED
jgi:hypothetical protein